MPNVMGATLPNEFKVAAGVHTTASAVDSVATGLRQVVAVVASFQTDPADANVLVSAVPGTAGAITIKTWKTDGTDPTPVAASAFSKVVNWVAFGY